MPKIPTLYLIAGGAVAAALAYTLTRGFKETGQQIGGAAVDLATGLLIGVAEPVTKAAGTGLDALSDNAAGRTFQDVAGWFGVPKTNPTECERAKAEGRTLDASFACPAGDFISYLWS